MRGALVSDEIVVNVIEYEDGFDPGPDLALYPLAAESMVAPGWSLAERTWTAPAPPAPPSTAEDPVTREEFDALLTLILEAMGGAA